jgi:hypothetical protein
MASQACKAPIAEAKLSSVLGPVASDEPQERRRDRFQTAAAAAERKNIAISSLRTLQLCPYLANSQKTDRPAARSVSDGSATPGLHVHA